MKIEKDFNLVKLNTFGVKVLAKFFVEINTFDDLRELFSMSSFKENKKIFLGGGSNVLFTKDFDGIVILNKLKGIEILNEDSDFILIKANSGEIWDDFVSFTVEKNLWGIENLALIPGSVGAAPMQNIGAYGRELKDVLENVEVFDLENGEKIIFSNKDCVFSYRDSVFKNKYKDRYFILSITLKLSKIIKKNVQYKILENYLNENKIEVQNSKDISMAVSNIRQSKLPDPKIIPNAGSFFKNILVEKEKFEELLNIYPDISYFRETDNEKIKISSAWLIEKCNWKGKRVGNVGVHERQALVLVNYGKGTGEELINLAEKIIYSVKDKFDLLLEIEVNII